MARDMQLCKLAYMHNHSSPFHGAILAELASTFPCIKAFAHCPRLKDTPVKPLQQLYHHRSSAGCQFNTTQKLTKPYDPQAAWTQRKGIAISGSRSSSRTLARACPYPEVNNALCLGSLFILRQGKRFYVFVLERKSESFNRKNNTT